MTSSDVFYSIGDGLYWLFQNTLEPIGEIVWPSVLIFGFVGFAYWMKRQADYNKQAEADPNQIK